MSVRDIKKLSDKEYIIAKGVRMHNLKNIDIGIPRDKLVVITGLSGSGKSSLAFDTLYAEGQRRYIESLSSYARQFLGKIDKPDVDYIRGISPAVAIEQKVNTRNTRSTVGTSTEIYDYLKLLFARIGKTISPSSGKEVKRDTSQSVVTELHQLGEGIKVMLTAPLQIDEDRKLQKQLSILLKQGFTRVYFENDVRRIEELIEKKVAGKHHIEVLIDRFSIRKDDEDNISRVYDSVETAFFEGHGECTAYIYNKGEKKPRPRKYSNRFEADGITFEEPSTHFFSFNSPVGACSTCEGYGYVIGIDEDLVIPDKSRSVYEDAIVCWKGEKMRKWKDKLVLKAPVFDFPVHKPYYDLSKEQKKLLWEGNKHFKGLNQFFKYLEKKSYKIQFRVMLSRYRGRTICHDCQGTRLRKDANYVKVSGKSITDIVLMPVNKALEFFTNIELDKHDLEVAKRLLTEIENRLSYLSEVGLNYLSLNRLSSTLSGGETQRINLATSLGSSLVGSTYILDEPSIGLHPRDTERLIGVLRSLQKFGNTVIIVEHDEDIIEAADEIIDLGPMAGSLGGELMFQGNREELQKETKSLTARYMNGMESIPVPEERRKWNAFIEVKGARQHNLKGIDVKFPLHTLTVITGVSGSGKSSLLKGILYPSVKKMFEGYGEKTGLFDKLEGDYKAVNDIQFIDQNPIGKSSRSNPVTYIKAYDEIRKLYSRQPLAKGRGYKPAFFSFNVDGGRCDNCKGEGEITVEMQFMADVHLQCEECKGKRFKKEILEITYREKNIADILDMTVDDALEFFSADKEENLAGKISNKLSPLQEVGLGYVHLGQSSSTLSGGEAQRIKLASFLSVRSTKDKILFIFDEPTTGLHFQDINKLLYALNALIKQGHSVIVIEHNLEIIKSADWIIDLGPEGGENGGKLVFEGTPEDLIKNKKSYTGKYLGKKLKN